MSTDIRVPDIGDFKDVPIIEIHVKPGDAIKVDDPLISLESDKASLEVPAPTDGTIAEVKVNVGDKVSQGDTILSLKTAGKSDGPIAFGGGAPQAVPQAKPPVAQKGDIHGEVIVLGGGPGG